MQFKSNLCFANKTEAYRDISMIPRVDILKSSFIFDVPALFGFKLLVLFSNGRSRIMIVRLCL